MEDELDPRGSTWSELLKKTLHIKYKQVLSYKDKAGGLFRLNLGWSISKSNAEGSFEN